MAATADTCSIGELEDVDQGKLFFRASRSGLVGFGSLGCRLRPLHFKGVDVSSWEIKVYKHEGLEPNAPIWPKPIDLFVFEGL